MSGLRALVVEDSPTMRQLIVLALRKLPGLEVVEANDGVDALKTLASGQVDIVITDINMPIMDGLKLVKRIRAADGAYATIPIIIITTEGADEDRVRALALGANTYITKPIQPAQVTAKVRELLKI